ncbi:hypothetical protein L208DRAFT_689981 [Tricholoma matsutake]|nr:hypothetical protein L208DRAFT_689981 [Tricholoma matsutake 945]
MTAAEDIKVPFFKKGKSRPTTSRKRSPSPSNKIVQATSKSEVVLPTRKAGGNLLSAGTKRTVTQREGHDDSDAPEKEGPDVKWTSSGSHANAALEIIAGDEIEELMAKRRRKEGNEGETEEFLDDGLYRGQGAYRSHLRKNKEIPKAMRVGPQKSTSTIRTVTIVDYQPDVCKDYKETGYCGFGDTCKFLHDRGTYLAGWQLDKLAETAKKDVNEEPDSDSDDEDVPFACLICRKHYTEPVVTRCGHYYCSSCAIKRYAKTPKCLACGAPTGGIFNRADKIIEKINKKRKDKEDKEAADELEAAPDIEIEGLDKDMAADSDSSDQ